ncbi:vacuolar segregation protein pep7 [Metarhizium rileyi]|uniref:Vacuolar segregation protein pep7 n=1 Tax=Metarhizium rileyi (strain RCEF 4871) TaxID=1649241 RepID=A0A167G3C7_METRR|nr:vacuolar segregation protein pep7 [Metarhizium rileyi RCEF 4871]
MSGRKLGGGRILGSGKGLAPPTPPSGRRSTSPLPPSESTVSMGSVSMSVSPSASSGLHGLGQDIGASISVGAQGKNNTADATGLVCPICNEEMVTLLQLNRHIDDTHQELPEAAQDEVKTWFDKQVLKAKRFQPLSLINQKLRGLEVFESNESNHISAPAVAPGKAPLDVPIDPDDLITRNHWQRPTSYDLCTDPACGRSLGPMNGSVNSLAENGNEKTSTNGEGSLVLDIRMCRECNHTIFSGRDFTASLLHKPPDQRAYETLRQFERGIRQLLPSFHRALQALQTPLLPNGEMDLSIPPPSHAQIQEAGKIRKRLIDSFGKYGMAAKRLRDLRTESPTQQMLQQAVYTYTNNFLHTNMLPLKSLPQVLRHRATPSQSSRLLVTPSQSTSSLRHSELASDAGSQAASETSTIMSQLETEEKDLKERLAVLEEQKFMVEDMIRSATGARRFEEVGALSRNVDELDKEIQQLKTKVGEVEYKWEGVYRNGGT